MNSLIPLLKITLRNTFGLSLFQYRYIRRRDRVWEPLLIGIALIMAFGSLGFMFMQLFRSMVVGGAALGQPELGLVMAILAVQVLLLFMGIFMVISAFFFANDLSVLIPLPLRPGHIMLSKFLAVVIAELAFALLIMLPAVIVFVQWAGGSIAFYVSALLVYLLVPVLPLVVSSLLALLLMRFISRRHRDTMMVIGSLLIVFVVMAAQFAITGNLADDPERAMEELLSGQVLLVREIGQRFPPSIWATDAMALAGTAEGWLNLALFVGSSLLATWFLMMIGEKLFQGAVVGGAEAKKRAKAMGQSEWARRTQAGSPFRSLFWREWKLFLRTPIFAMNGLTGAIIVPIMMVFSLFAQGDQLSRLAETLAENPTAVAVAPLAVAALISFVASMNTISSTAVSREGKLFYFSKMIPVSVDVQIKAKLAHALAIGLLSAVPTLLVYWYLLRPTIFSLLIAVVLGFSGSLITLIVGLLVDMSRPYLNWTNPQQAVKQNLNVVFALALQMAIIGVSAFITLRMFAADLSHLLIYAVLFIFFQAGSLIAYQVTLSQAERLYHKLEL